MCGTGNNLLNKTNSISVAKFFYTNAFERTRHQKRALTTNYYYYFFSIEQYLWRFYSGREFSKRRWISKVVEFLNFTETTCIWLRAKFQIFFFLFQQRAKSHKVVCCNIHLLSSFLWGALLQLTLLRFIGFINQKHAQFQWLRVKTNKCTVISQILIKMPIIIAFWSVKNNFLKNLFHWLDFWMS